MKDVNRLKIVLVEKKKNKQMARRTVECKPFNCFQMVHEQFAARFADSCQDCKAAGGNC